MDEGDGHRWALESFGGAELGDVRRTSRLVRVAAGVARRPGGTVTGVFQTSAECEATFRLLESDGVRPEAVAAALFTATGERCTDPGIIVAVDQSSLTLGDRAQKRELGRIGTSVVKSRGLEVMTALAIDGNGTPIGLLSQDWWLRDKPPVRRRTARKCYGDDYLDRETRFWVQAIDQVDAVLQENGGARPWFQMDRGADAWPVFRRAIELGHLLTVRARANRRVELESGRTTYLDEVLASEPVLGRYKLEVPAQRGRDARTAQMAIRVRHVTLRVRVSKEKRVALALNAVLVVETNRRRRDRLRWLLLTTNSIDTLDDARKIVAAYTRRWRIEEFHRAWKSGVCNVEQTQLQSKAAITKWATILASVAARAVRLAHLVRTTPDAPASVEFSDDEIDATYVLADKPRDRRRSPTLGDVLAMVAELGGFMGKYSRRKPGAIVLARGLADVEVLARALPRLRKMR